MLSYEAVQLKKLLAEEKDIRNRYISAAEEISAAFFWKHLAALAPISLYTIFFWSASPETIETSLIFKALASVSSISRLSEIALTAS